MNKLLLSTAVTAVLFAGQAMAVPVGTLALNANGSPNVTDAYTKTVKEVWISGSSAATPFVEKSIAADCTGNIYKYSNSTTDFTWICDSSIAASTINIVHKRDSGGSITGAQSALGTNPTYWQAASFTNTTCATATTSNGVTVVPCTPTGATAAAHAGDINLTDVDGAQFESIPNGHVVGAAGTTATALATQIFGVVVNTRLYAAMQVASVAAGKIASTCIGGITPGASSFTMPTDNTDACMPSLTTEQIAAIAGKGRATDWWNLYFGGADNTAQSLAGVQYVDDQPANTDIHYCSRTAGSGTLAAFNIKFENQCFTGNEALSTNATQLIGAETDSTSGGQKVVHAMSGSGDLENCLIGLNQGALQGTFTPYPSGVTGFRWAFGIMGLDRNNTVAKNYRFIKIDGFAPTAANVAAGKYKFWAELVNLTSSSAPLTTNPLALDILANLGSAPQITALNVTHPFGLSGFLGTATNVNYLPTFDTAISPGTLINGAFDAARPVNPFTHAAAGGSSLNHCRMPSIPGGMRAIPAF